MADPSKYQITEEGIKEAQAYVRDYKAKIHESGKWYETDVMVSYLNYEKYKFPFQAQYVPSPQAFADRVSLRTEVGRKCKIVLMRITEVLCEMTNGSTIFSDWAGTSAAGAYLRCVNLMKNENIFNTEQIEIMGFVATHEERQSSASLGADDDYSPEEIAVRVRQREYVKSLENWMKHDTNIHALDRQLSHVLNTPYHSDLVNDRHTLIITCLLYTSPSPRDQRGSRMPSSA